MLKTCRILGAASLITALGASADVAPAPDINLRSLFYDFRLMAATSAGGFTALGDSPSIDRLGRVAFQASNVSGQGAYLSDGVATTDLTPGFDGASRAFGRAVMLSDTGWAIESDRSSGSPPATFIRAWPASGSGAFLTLGRGGAGQPFDAVLSHPAISADGGNWAFTALARGSTVTRLVTPQGETDLLGNGGTGYRPMVANDGSVVLRDSNSSLLQLQLRRGGNLGAPEVIAATSSGFAQIGNQPGVADTGRVVAFSGNRGNGPGVFVAYQASAGAAWTVERVAGEGVAAQGEVPDLGFDATGSPLFFTAVNLDSRVGVMHQERGAAGLDGDTVVLTFVATPNGASTYPRFGHLPGLFFRESAGIWTLRIDFRRDVNGVLQARRRYAIPVVQVGDTITGENISNFVIANLAVHDPIAEATTDDVGRALTRPAGSHRIAFWANDAAGSQVILRGTHVNSCLVAVRHYSQCDPAWNSSPYVGGPDNFCAKACALTAQTMAANTGGASYGMLSPATPQAVHDFIRSRSGFNGKSVAWAPSIQALRQAGGSLALRSNALRFQMSRYAVLPNSSPTTIDTAMNYLDDQLCDDAEPAPVVVAADREPNATGVMEPGHFILVAGRVNDRRFIADPGYANGILFSQGPSHNTVSTQYQRNFETRGVVKDPPDLGGFSIFAVNASRLLVTDATGARSGWRAGVAEPQQGIPGATAWVDGLRNLNATSAIQDVVHGFQTPTPAAQPYVVQFVGRGGAYSLTAQRTLSDGTLTTPVTINGVAAAGEVVALTVSALPGGSAIQKGSTMQGDLDGDLDIDIDDVNYLLFDRNKSVASSRCGARCDLNGDARIDALDARKLSMMCTRPGCAAQ